MPPARPTREPAPRMPEKVRIEASLEAATLTAWSADAPGSSRLIRAPSPIDAVVSESSTFTTIDPARENPLETAPARERATSDSLDAAWTASPLADPTTADPPEPVAPVKTGMDSSEFAPALTMTLAPIRATVRLMIGATPIEPPIPALAP